MSPGSSALTTAITVSGRPFNPTNVAGDTN